MAATSALTLTGCADGCFTETAHTDFPPRRLLQTNQHDKKQSAIQQPGTQRRQLSPVEASHDSCAVQA